MKCLKSKKEPLPHNPYLIKGILLTKQNLKIMEHKNIKILQAMLLMAETLTYSSTYKEDLIKEIQAMIANHHNS